MAAHDGEGAGTGPSYSLILPTYNAASFLGQTWQRVRRFLEGTSEEWEALFVCDGCTDGTPGLLAELTAGMPGRVRVLSYAANRGKGHAVRCGLEAARGRWRIFTDVDLAYGFDDVLRVARTLRAGTDIAIASRTHADSRLIVAPQLQGYAYRRHLQSILFSALVRRLLPLRQRDTQAGLKGLSAHAVGLLLPYLRCNGFGFDCELLVAAVSQRLRIVEVPVTLQWESSASTTSLWSMGRIVRELWMIRQTWRHGQLAGPKPVSSGQQRQAA